LEHSAIIERLEEEIRLYQVEYQRFFNGESKLPPEAQAKRIRLQLNRLNGISQLTSVEQFRLGSIEGRYNSLSELFRRRMRDMDYSQRRAPEGADPGATSAIVLDPGTGTDEVAPLYDTLYAQRNTNVALEDFHAYLLKQATKVRERTGCTRVQFSIASPDGKPKLKVRPMPSEDNA
jgi:hypothetical protein